MRENPHTKVAKVTKQNNKNCPAGGLPFPSWIENLRDLYDLYVSLFSVLYGDSPVANRLMNSILVVQLKRLGDLILTTPALSALRKMYPEAQITLLIDHHSAELAPAIADVNEILIYNKSGSFNLWFDLVKRRFDLCLDFTGNDRSALVSFLSKAAQRVGFSFVAKRAIRSWVYTHLVQSAVRERHTVDHYIDLVQSLGDFGPAGGVSLCLPDSVERSAETLRREIGLPGYYFVVHPGSARPDKYWLADRWKVVIAHAQKRLGIPCLITGSRNPVELEHIREIVAGARHRSAIFNLAGKVDFLLSAAMIREGTLFIGVDTSAAHLAAAFRRPEVVLFGPTNPFHWHPRHPHASVVRAGFEEPLDHFEPRQKGLPMSELSTEAVIRAMEVLLNGLK
jgi:ADP-heptose:LPS heptosyltransferase